MRDDHKLLTAVLANFDGQMRTFGNFTFFGWTPGHPRYVGAPASACVNKDDVIELSRRFLLPEATTDERFRYVLGIALADGPYNAAALARRRQADKALAGSARGTAA